LGENRLANNWFRLVRGVVVVIAVVPDAVVLLVEGGVGGA
jgi:hypothetical protein